MNGRWPGTGIPRQAPVGGPWTPADDVGLQAWWDAQDAASFGVTAGNKFSRWTTRNNAAVYMEQTDAGYQGTYTGGWITLGLVVRYIIYNSPAVQGAFVAAAWYAPRDYSCLFATGSYNPALYLWGEAGTIQRYPGGSYGANSQVYSANTIVTLPNFCAVGAAAYRNGTNSGTFSGSVWGTSVPDRMLWDGYDGVDGACQDIIISTSNDDATRQKYEGYLAHKTSLAGNLPAGHPYKSAPPTK